MTFIDESLNSLFAHCKSNFNQGDGGGGGCTANMICDITNSLEQYSARPGASTFTESGLFKDFKRAL